MDVEYDPHFEEWYDSLADGSAAVVTIYVKRVVRGGSRKNVRYVGDEIWEIKISSKGVGGLRVYFGKLNGLLILLGGNKSTQRRDIDNAKSYWREYAKKK